MPESIVSKEEAIRALKIMDAVNQLARRYPVPEVLAVVKQWAAYMDKQIATMAEPHDGEPHA